MKFKKKKINFIKSILFDTIKLMKQATKKESLLSIFLKMTPLDIDTKLIAYRSLQY